MLKKKIVIILTAVIVLAASVLGVTTVFRVRGVTVETAVISQIAEEEAKVLQEKLLKAYKYDSSFFVDDKKAKKIMEDFPYFRLMGFEKSYPDRVLIQVAEHVESYAVKKADGDGYFIIGDDGLVLSERDSSLNRLDGMPNVVIEGDGLNVSGVKGQKLVGDEKWKAVLQFCNSFSVRANGIRDNVINVTVSKYAPLCLTMREGVKIYVGAVESLTIEKADAAVAKYIGLTDAERLNGMIMVDEKEGQVIVSYQIKDFN
jgi:hypothetical protein